MNTFLLLLDTIFFQIFQVHCLALLNKFKFVCFYYNTFIPPKTSPLETQSVSGGRLLELPFMFCSGVRWSFSFWLNVFVWVVTLWLWIIAPSHVLPKNIVFHTVQMLFLVLDSNAQLPDYSGKFFRLLHMFGSICSPIAFNFSFLSISPLAFLLQFSFEILIFLVFLNA